MGDFFLRAHRRVGQHSL